MLAIVGIQEFLWISKWRIGHNNIYVIPYEGLQLHLFLLDDSLSGGREMLCSFIDSSIHSTNIYMADTILGIE